MSIGNGEWPTCGLKSTICASPSALWVGRACACISEIVRSGARYKRSFAPVFSVPTFGFAGGEAGDKRDLVADASWFVLVGWGRARITWDPAASPSANQATAQPADSSAASIARFW